MKIISWDQTCESLRIYSSFDSVVVFPLGLRSLSQGRGLFRAEVWATPVADPDDPVRCRIRASVTGLDPTRPVAAAARCNLKRTTVDRNFLIEKYRNQQLSVDWMVVHYVKITTFTSSGFNLLSPFICDILSSSSSLATYSKRVLFNDRRPILIDRLV